MQFELSSKNIKDGKIAFLIDGGAPSGIRKITEKVGKDLAAVFGAAPKIVDLSSSEKDLSGIAFPILVYMDGKGATKASSVSKLEKKGLLDFSAIRGKREVYMHKVADLPEGLLLPGKSTAFVIAGSDKRGTVYGLFALSEMLGVSPFIDWLDIRPEKKRSFTIASSYSFTSKEPSVRFRGFFINDEWPAFGNYCNKRFGGFNAKCYEHVFELLLRLKGNYLWPAMWSAIFPDDGPGLQSAELADELGVVMGASHHEPCCRQGEEYRYLRGPKSIYGDAWNFLSNEKGITKFWEDGLKRSGKFENVITVGMRGEQDTAIMGKDATLKDNIDLLRKVLCTQNKLIKKYVNKDLDQVPRMLALYKEVEPYFYGDEKTRGLMGDPELDGVTLMLCDDNYGNLRTVPTEEMHGHKGGYGMYYHFDYHGFPISYEWLNTTHLSKVWEQMTSAYDFGIRDLWIVNVGDIFSTEYPLSYFLDLAYDFSRWGTENKNSAHEYTKYFVEKNFGPVLSEKQKKETAELLLGYTGITHSRRTEAMNDDVYAPFAYEETETMLKKIGKLMSDAEKLYGDLSGNAAYRFYEIVYLPLMGNLNVQKMWLYTTLNHAYAKMGSSYALVLADEMDLCLEKDREIVEELHKIHGGMWYGMGLSEHIGFRNWCEEGCQYPVVETFAPGNKDRLIARVGGTSDWSEFGPWTRKELTVPAFLDPRASVARIELTTASRRKQKFTVECDSAFVTVTPVSGAIDAFGRKDLIVRIDRSKLPKKNSVAKITVRSGDGFVQIRVPYSTEKELLAQMLPAKSGAAKVGAPAGRTAKNSAVKSAATEKNTFFWCEDEVSHAMNYISILSENYSEKIDGKKGGFEKIPDYSRGFSGMKAFPQDVTFSRKGEGPALRYRVYLKEKGEYTLALYSSPGNPPTKDPQIFCGVAANGGSMKRINIIPEGFAVGDGNDIWKKGVLDNQRVTKVPLTLKEGENTIDITAISPNFTLVKLVLSKKDAEPEESYLGPTETYHS